MDWRIRSRSGNTATGDTDNSSIPIARKVSSRDRSAPNSPQMPIQMPALCAASAEATYRGLMHLSHYAFSRTSQRSAKSQAEPLPAVRLYRNMYLQINSTASTYISGVTFFALPQHTFTAT